MQLRQSTLACARCFLRLLGQTARATQAAAEALLPKVELLEMMSTEQLKHLAGVMREEEHDAEDLLFCQGDPGDQLYVLVSGTATAEKDGEEVQHYARPGDYFGEVPAEQKRGHSRTM